MNEDRGGRRISTADMIAATNELDKDEELRDEQNMDKNTSQTTEDIEPLFEEDNVDDYRSRWLSIQTRFVDDPQDSVRDADELVAEVIQNIAEIFAEERSYLEEQWKEGSEVSTEDLRVSLKRYRSFFNRLLSISR